MSIVIAKNLRKLYGNFVAVDDISFEIKQGEIFGFLGPNGAGKTSTINMLIGLSRITSGNVIIDGIDCTKTVKKAQSIMGIVPDESNLYDEMNGFDNLCFCGSLYGMRKKEREFRAAKMLEQFNLSDVSQRLYKTYSKGMRRRLCIAAAIMHSPKILFLDEPTTGIDIESARQIRRLIIDLKNKGTTVFITTHYIEDAQRICDRVTFIVNGKIVKSGSVSELMTSSENGFALRLKHTRLSSEIAYEFNDMFSSIGLETINENECLLRSDKRISIAQIIDFFEKRNIDVYEATEARQTLEDVFVKITGIDAKKLEKEKEGKR